MPEVWSPGECDKSVMRKKDWTYSSYWFPTHGFFVKPRKSFIFIGCRIAIIVGGNNNRANRDSGRMDQTHSI